jgi:hypothetical protein
VAQAHCVVAVLEQWSGAMARLVREHITTCVPRVKQVIDLERRRVIEGISVPAEEELTSLF